LETLGTGDSKSWTIHIGDSFTDVPSGTPQYRFVETILHNGVTAGCTVTTFCPSNDVSRQQMAVLLLLSKQGIGYAPPACVTPAFADVPCSSPFAPWVNELFNRGVVAGCGNGNYCPTDSVTRAPMSVFILRTLHGSSFNPPPCVTPVFADVPCSNIFAPWINELQDEEITNGCAPGLFCPTGTVSRGQMAVFLVTAFTLKLY
jgi:hypothetical protein